MDGVKATTVVVFVECCVVEEVGWRYDDRETMVVVRQARTWRQQWWKTKRRWEKERHKSE